MPEIGLVAIIGTNTSSGKSSFADAMDAFFQSAKVQVGMLRIETGERRREFPEADLFIDSNRASEGANLVGGIAGLFDEVWPQISETIGQRGVVVVDCGAGAQNLLLQAAGVAGLDDLIGELGASCCIVVVTTPEAECGRQAVRLVSEARASMANVQIVLAVNRVNALHTVADTLAHQAFSDAISGLNDVARINVPYCRGQAIDCFKGANIAKILKVKKGEELMRQTRKGLLASRAAQSHLGAWYGAISDQLLRVFWP
jgi:hypothetical protein